MGLRQEEELSKLNESVRELCPKNGVTRMQLWRPSLLACRDESPRDGGELNNAGGKSVTGMRTERGGSGEQCRDEKPSDSCVVSRRSISSDSSRMPRASSSRAARNFNGSEALAAVAGSVESFWKADDRVGGVNEDWKEKTFMRDRGGVEGRKSRERLVSGNEWLRKREQMLLSRLSLADQ